MALGVWLFPGQPEFTMTSNGQLLRTSRGATQRLPADMFHFIDLEDAQRTLAQAGQSLAGTAGDSPRLKVTRMSQETWIRLRCDCCDTTDDYLVGPSRPVIVLHGYYTAERPDGKTDKIRFDRIHPHDGGEVRGELFRRRTGRQKDPHYDERFQRPVTDSELLHKIPPLRDALRAELDQLHVPPSQSWQQLEIPVPADQQVVAISADGSQLIDGAGPDAMDRGAGSRDWRNKEPAERRAGESRSEPVPSQVAAERVQSAFGSLWVSEEVAPTGCCDSPATRPSNFRCTIFS